MVRPSDLLQVMLGSACVLEAVGSDGTLDERNLERWVIWLFFFFICHPILIYFMGDKVV